MSSDQPSPSGSQPPAVGGRNTAPTRYQVMTKLACIQDFIGQTEAIMRELRSSDAVSCWFGKFKINYFCISRGVKNSMISSPQCWLIWGILKRSCRFCWVAWIRLMPKSIDFWINRLRFLNFQATNRVVWDFNSIGFVFSSSLILAFQLAGTYSRGFRVSAFKNKTLRIFFLKYGLSNFIWTFCKLLRILLSILYNFLIQKYWKIIR